MATLWQYPKNVTISSFYTTGRPAKIPPKSSPFAPNSTLQSKNHAPGGGEAIEVVQKKRPPHKYRTDNSAESSRVRTLHQALSSVVELKDARG